MVLFLKMADSVWPTPPSDMITGYENANFESNDLKNQLAEIPDAMMKIIVDFQMNYFTLGRVLQEKQHSERYADKEITKDMKLLDKWHGYVDQHLNHILGCIRSRVHDLKTDFEAEKVFDSARLAADLNAFECYLTIIHKYNDYIIGGEITSLKMLIIFMKEFKTELESSNIQ